MDANKVLKVLKLGAHLEANAEPLDDLAAVPPKDVHADNLLLLRNHADDLGVAGVVAALGDSQLERLEGSVVHLNVVSAVLRDRVLLRKSHAPVLDGGKDGGGDIDIVHLLLGTSEEPAREQDSRPDGDGGQLIVSVQDVADGKDVLNTALLRASHPRALSHHLLGGGVDLDPRGGGVALVGQRVAADGDQNRVILVRGELPPIPRSCLPADLDLPARKLLKSRRDDPPDETCAVRLHILGDVLSALLIKPTQGDTAHHDSRVIPQPREEARTLQSHIRRADHERLARGLLHREKVIRCDAALTLVGQPEVLGAPAGGDDDLVGRAGGLLALLVRQLDRVGVDKARQAVQVLDALLAQRCAVPEVEGADVVLDVVHHGLPVVRLGPLARELPPEALGVLGVLPDQGGLVHQLLGDAPHVDARAPEAPSGS
mmetsp:Transcript_32293/g.63099  ORF Transcript_32293/g.63099 Transcript_32293/m.63099 type:complete len:430 (+) Transcript_32293:174-1463(+)